MSSVRVTVTLPAELLQDIDREESNRSGFILEAVRRELERRKREQLRRSLNNPHSESEVFEELGLESWAQELPEEDEELVLKGAGRPIRWIAGEGWVAGK